MSDTPPEKARVAPSAPSARADGGELGDYILSELILDQPATETWHATQVSVQREVALERLKPAFAENPAALDGFRALVRARAAVVHPYIAPVYETQETNGSVYYTRELVRGRDLAQLHAEGARLSPDEVVGIFLATAEAMAYLDGNGTPRAGLTSSSIHLGHDGIPRLDNLATAHEADLPDVQAELQQTGQALSVLLHRGMPDSSAADVFLKSLIRGGVSDWAQASTHARRQMRAFAGVKKAATTAPVGTTPHPATAKISHPKKRSNPVVLIATLLVCAVIVAGAYFALTAGSSTPGTKDFDRMIPIPAGAITGPNGSEQVAAFLIDEYEVTIDQYAAFLIALGKGEAGRFDHPNQPSSKTSHATGSWEALHKAARANGQYEGQPVSLNHPIMAVDWWDAYAFAKWKGHRLPTAPEWHLAALGTAPEARFPWGKSDAPSLYNSGSDFAQHGPGGEVDGYNFWAPVDAFSNDRSPQGVFGMAGNVSEWVDTWVHHPHFPDRRVPIVMGGSFATTSAKITERRPAKKPEAAQLAVGFRTARSHIPSF